ncbi:hypothetical protein F2P81_005596 [Scophthalmus maximus]|uniref:Secreted protein n=1 Tax=Scophthalmus maximus TaxID=52904 RepID=A0A6A4TFR6_SCOMX|nr:hypothetical protein F2P81_005596 [Scophthalmus maximus]
MWKKLLAVQVSLIDHLACATRQTGQHSTQQKYRNTQNTINIKVMYLKVEDREREREREKTDNRVAEYLSFTNGYLDFSTLSPWRFE